MYQDPSVVDQFGSQNIIVVEIFKDRLKKIRRKFNQLENRWRSEVVDLDEDPEVCAT